ncbi:MAG: hypothetical protein AAF986_06045 [Pseudomonadota bacterium]
MAQFSMSNDITAPTSFGSVDDFSKYAQKNLDRQESPTAQTYGELSKGYDFFNKELFHGELPGVVFTLTRRKSCLGYFAGGKTNNIIKALRDKLEDHQAKLDAAERHLEELADKVRGTSGLEVVVPQKPQSDHDYNGIKGWLYENFGRIGPRRQFKLFLLFGTAIGISTVGASSILNYLMEYSDIYASNPLLAVPLLMVPVGAGVGLELILEKIKDVNLKGKLEGAVSVTCIVSVILWLMGLLDMANVGGAFDDSFTLLPKGLRAAAQIVFEITGITLVSSAIYEILREAAPDELRPSSAKRLHQDEHDAYERTEVTPLARRAEKAKLFLSSYEGHRDEFLEREKADFAVVCMQHDDLHNRTYPRQPGGAKAHGP